MRFKLVYIIHSLVLILVAFSIYYFIIRFKDSHEAIILFETSYEEVYSFKAIIYTLTHTNLLRLPLLLTPALTGVFVKGRVGWILISSLGYLTLNITLFYGAEFYLNEIIILILLSLSYILFLNYKKISFDHYKTLKENLLGVNIISYTLSVLMIFILLKLD